MSKPEARDRPREAAAISAEAPGAPVAEAWRAGGDQILRSLTRRLGSPTAAEDVAQDALERALRAWPATGVSRPTAFLARIALNLAVNHVISERRRTATLVAARDYLFAQLDRPDAARQIETREALEALRTGLASLPERTRRILMLNRVEGLSQTLIAKQLGVSRTTVEKHMRRALAHLSTLREG